ncbi:hypothetical protein B0H34DRAFT_675627 [Crassisporium funariophilum]|nr:hypothetical protein B0H34DRAFT_675627 [Crassisporium funariophilum]
MGRRFWIPRNGPSASSVSTAFRRIARTTNGYTFRFASRACVIITREGAVTDWSLNKAGMPSGITPRASGGQTLAAASRTKAPQWKAMVYEVVLTCKNLRKGTRSSAYSRASGVKKRVVLYIGVKGYTRPEGSDSMCEVLGMEVHGGSEFLKLSWGGKCCGFGITGTGEKWTRMLNRTTPACAGFWYLVASEMRDGETRSRRVSGAKREDGKCKTQDARRACCEYRAPSSRSGRWCRDEGYDEMDGSTGKGFGGRLVQGVERRCISGMDTPLFLELNEVGWYGGDAEDSGCAVAVDL